ncbi:MAG TPA: trans-aconitate 2-methyltransferase [Acetobacteraceae bacterium]|jgi:trans-aconitate 2-methyltransferase|nr:trans-aconitate 2-methyltransferase [Acetobacteraceae bacterium]
MSWSARQYTSFEAERTRPVRDLLNAVTTGPVRRAVDLGCGPGNSTEVLSARFPGAAVTGLDSSADMIAAARSRLPTMRFDLAGIEDWSDPDPFDVILANAVLQWVPNHETLLPRLVGKLAAGGSLAVQMPDNLDEPAHQLMREVAASGRWKQKLAGSAGARAPRRGAEWYYALLRDQATGVDIWRTTYYHVLTGGTDAVVEWFKGSGLRPFLAPLDPSEATNYLAEYRALLVDAYKPLPDGTVLLPFPRLFLIVRR